jgi:hypothetical protein
MAIVGIYRSIIIALFAMGLNTPPLAAWRLIDKEESIVNIRDILAGNIKAAKP